MIIWLVGISGAGKSTLGKLLLKNFIDKGKLCIMIDGDDFRLFFDNDLGYSVNDRMENIKRIIAAAKAASDTGAVVIVCNISPFEELRKFCRSKLPNYREVFLDKAIDLASKNDVKKIYENSAKEDLVGIGIKFERPSSPDLIINVDKYSIDESVKKITDFLNV